MDMGKDGNLEWENLEKKKQVYLEKSASKWGTRKNNGNIEFNLETGSVGK